MKCPECKTKITERHWDADFEMYECPGCGGLITKAELVHAESEKLAKSKGPVAKAKKKKIDRAEDDVLADEHAEAVAKSTRQSNQPEKVKHSVPTVEVKQIMADAIEEIYEEFGQKLERYNAEDKALTLFRAAVYGGRGATVKEKNFKVVSCGRHS